MNMDSKERFSSRVSDYVRYRPSYPAEVVTYLHERCGCGATTVAADIGSGTGIFSGLLLTCASRVYAIEPNAEMRRAAEQRFSHDPRFISLAASAEDTTLPDASVGLITAAQSFHWFDLERARTEFSRILRPDGWVVLIWNARLTDASEFLAAYDQFLRNFGTDYERVNHANVEQGALGGFFGAQGFESASFANEQVLDFDGLRGRVVSSSYMPNAGDPQYEEMTAELQRLFERFKQDGSVRLLYHTNVYTGRIS